MPKAALNEGLIQPNTKIWIWLLNAYYEFNILIFVHIITKPGGLLQYKASWTFKSTYSVLIKKFYRHWPLSLYPIQWFEQCNTPESKVHGAHMGPTGPRWAPWGPREPCSFGPSSTRKYFVPETRKLADLNQHLTLNVHWGASTNYKFYTILNLKKIYRWT